MKTIKASKLREVLSSKGVDEGFIDRIFHRVKMARQKDDLKGLKKDLDKLEKDPQFNKILKKYGIKQVN
tara:strand:+ start:52 stop:258 length:207 start_codon:yes stop_codon:yes gene_type:complete